MSLTASLQSVIDRITAAFASASATTTTTSNLSGSRAYLVGLSTFLAVGGLLVVYDKHGWTAYGTGGTPPTWAGYWKANVVLRTKRLLQGSSLRDASQLSSTGRKYLTSKLPVRTTTRPASTHWTLPQRQKCYQTPSSSSSSSTTSPPSHQHHQHIRIAGTDNTKALLTRLHGIVDRLVNANPDILTKDLSNTEGRSVPAIYAVPNLPGRDPAASSPILGHEIAHVHSQENSLHVWLAEADAEEVIAKGWGENFPLSTLGLTPNGLCFLYAPTTEQELEVVESIVKAGVKYLTGKDV